MRSPKRCADDPTRSLHVQASPSARELVSKVFCSWNFSYALCFRKGPNRLPKGFKIARKRRSYEPFHSRINEMHCSSKFCCATCFRKASNRLPKTSGRLQIRRSPMPPGPPGPDGVQNSQKTCPDTNSRFNTL